MTNDYLIHQRLERSALDHPASVAVATVDRSVTYERLDQHAGQIASTLMTSGVTLGDRVGVLMDKSPAAVAALYGVMKAGGVYVPIDPAMPVPRIVMIAEDCGLQVIVTEAGLLPEVAEVNSAVGAIHTALVVDGSADRGDGGGLAVLDVDVIGDSPPQVPSLSILDTDLAYILYTSGSTGRPKGVMLSHRNALAFVDWAVDEVSLHPDDRLSSHAPFHFDLSIFDLYAAASVGASVTIVPKVASMFPAELIRFIDEQAITVWYSVPSILTMLVQRGGLGAGALPSLRAVVFAGEVFPTRHLAALMQAVPHASFHNWYGPTETNVCTAYRVPDVPRAADGDIPIGRAIANVRASVVDESGADVSPGEVGELLISGATVMRGYWGDEDKTSQRMFVDRGAPGFRTGDLVKADDAGSYRFVGRKDHQIKSRGYRIELGEIETVLYSHEDVALCAVVALPDETITNRIKAYVVSHSPLLDASALVGFCSERIPRYMIPESFEFVDELPLTSTGKVDRQRLVG